MYAFEEASRPVLYERRGTASSRIAPFVGSDVLLNIINVAEAMPNKRMKADARR
jgi:hypothetical protein